MVIQDSTPILYNILNSINLINNSCNSNFKMFKKLNDIFKYKPLKIDTLKIVSKIQSPQVAKKDFSHFFRNLVGLLVFRKH